MPTTAVDPIATRAEKDDKPKFWPRSETPPANLSGFHLIPIGGETYEMMGESYDTIEVNVASLMPAVIIRDSSLFVPGGTLHTTMVSDFHIEISPALIPTRLLSVLSEVPRFKPERAVTLLDPTDAKLIDPRAETRIPASTDKI
jgi:hypothetical protein